MKVTKRSDQELQSMNLIADGQYPFEVIEAEDRVSKSGNEMISLKLKIWDIHNRERLIFDYLLDSMAHKVKHFCQATGLENKYEDGNLMARDCLGKSGYLELITQKDKTGQYPDKNAVKDYIVTEGIPAKTEESSFFNDDIKF